MAGRPFITYERLFDVDPRSNGSAKSYELSLLHNCDGMHHILSSLSRRLTSELAMCNAYTYTCRHRMDVDGKT